MGEVAWGPWLLVLILGGGVYFLVLSRLLPFRYIGHGVALLLGKYDETSSPGEINHFQALSSALAGTIGMGNIAGLILAALVSLVIFGGLQRIAGVASRLVPAMSLVYVMTTMYVVISHIDPVPANLVLIFTDAFSGLAVAGGALGTVIATGIRGTWQGLKYAAFDACSHVHAKFLAGI